MVSSNGTFVERAALSKTAISPVTQSWTSLGPQPTANTALYGNVSGRVTALAVDPCDATGNTVYAGGADGGVWVSFNALSGSPVTWKPLTDSEPSLSTGALALGPSCGTFAGGHTQSSLILAGTGESNYALDNLYGAGVLRSQDGGQTWTRDITFTSSASQGPGASGPYIAALAVQPHQTNPVILAAVQGTDYAAGGSLPSGVWRSTDGGNSWSRVQPGGGGAGRHSIRQPMCGLIPAMPPAKRYMRRWGIRTATRLRARRARLGLATAFIFRRCRNYVESSDGPRCSVSTVELWKYLAGIAPGSSPVVSRLYVAIADASTNSDNLLGVLSGTGIQPNGSGPAFSAIYPNASNLPDFCAPQCFYDMKIAVVPGTSGQTIFAGGSAQPQFGDNAFGTSSLYRSLDGGNTGAT